MLQRTNQQINLAGNKEKDNHPPPPKSPEMVREEKVIARVCQVTPASGIGGEPPQSGDSASGERLPGSGLGILIVPCPRGRGVVNRAAEEQPGWTLMELGVPR